MFSTKLFSLEGSIFHFYIQVSIDHFSMICAEILSFLQELEAIKARVRQMEEEAAKLKQMQSEVDKQMTSPAGSASALNMSYEEKVCFIFHFKFLLRK